MPEYKSEYTSEISFPLGGIGTGSIGLDGSGHLRDWEIFGRPAKGSLCGYTHIALRAEWNGKSQVKILQGDYQGSLMGSHADRMFAGYGFGPDQMTMAGFPHFKYSEFKGEFPIASIDFYDDDGFPLRARLTAVSPFIPQNSHDSSLPAAMFRIELENISGEDVECDVYFSLGSPAKLTYGGENINKEVSFPVHNGNIARGACMFDVMHKKTDIGYFDMTLVTDSENAEVYPYWYRGGWNENVQTYVNELSAGKLSHYAYSTPGKGDTLTVRAPLTMASGESSSTDFLMTWSVPMYENYWDQNAKDENGAYFRWKNWYATVFDTSFDTAVYFMNNKTHLISETELFRNSLFSSSLDDAVKDAVSANLSVLRSPTVTRLEDGTFYGWEGVMETVGSCEGSCTHVWNYNYALPFLFPDLERSLREAEYKYCQFPDGCMSFRMLLPIGYGLGWRMPALDGTMGGIIKIYREWKLSGDADWLRRMWSAVKRSLEFTWSESNECRWDENMDGVLEGRQHNTLDIELFGPTPWLQGFYLAALKAAGEICDALNDSDGGKYRDIFAKGQKWCEENLFNGRYYVQKLDLTDKSITDKFDCSSSYWNENTGEIRFQIGDGCDIDQLCGQWHASICGLGDIFDKKHRRSALESIYKYNFKKSFRGVMNIWRNFVLNDEAGTVMFSYPDGAYRPRMPISYCEETMHGFEYQFAGLLLSEGMTDKALEIVRAVRDRYDGKKRNPWGEMECGCNYARSLASFALLPISAGFTFDMAKGSIGFNPPGGEKEYKFMWSAGDGWGMANVSPQLAELTVNGGQIRLSELYIPAVTSVKSINIDGKDIEFIYSDGLISFKTCEVCNKVVIKGGSAQ